MTNQAFQAKSWQLSGIAQGLLFEGEDTDTVKFQNSNLNWLLLVLQVIAFGKHTTKPAHTQFEIKIFAYGKGAAN